MTKTNLLKATKDSFSQYKDGLITKQELYDQLEIIEKKANKTKPVNVFIDKLNKEMEKYENI